ncbi:MAG TPA: hypothetical protein VLT33_23625, partial [Labilithrix sp.]|nr:hypothetical protein [Labilithrix sp.]
MITSRLPLAGLVVSVALIGACRTQPPDPTTSASSQKTTATPSTDPRAATADSGVPAVADAAVAAADAEAPAAAEPLAGTLFTKEVQAAFRVAACAGDDSFIPAGVDKKMVDTHCGMLTSGYAEYKKEWIDVAGPFLA